MERNRAGLAGRDTHPSIMNYRNYHHPLVFSFRFFSVAVPLAPLPLSTAVRVNQLLHTYSGIVLFKL